MIRVHLPPLRERREDIPRLARHFLQIAARELGVEAKQLHPETETALTRLAWPGNVRQLENTCRWLTVMAAGQEVLTQDLPSELFETTVPDSPTQMQPDSWATLLGQWADRALAIRSSKPALRSATRNGAHAADDRPAPYPGAQAGGCASAGMGS